MTNLSRNAGGFWTFHLFNYVAYITMQGFFRTFGLMCRNFDSAFRFAGIIIPNMVQYVGYMIPVFDMKRWLFWIYYINPISYGKMILCTLCQRLTNWPSSLLRYDGE